jgi:hypothetical protein
LDLQIPIERLAATVLAADPDAAAAMDDADESDEDPAPIGDHEHVVTDDEDGSSDEDGNAADDDDASDVRDLRLMDCVLTEEQWRETAAFEAIYGGALREAMTLFQTASYNTLSRLLPVMTQLRRYYNGSTFLMPQRTSDHKQVRRKEYPMVPISRNDLPTWAVTSAEVLVQQIDARFLKRKMNKYPYIATIMDPRNKLDSCFVVGDAVSEEEAIRMYEDELRLVEKTTAGFVSTPRTGNSAVP